MPESITCRSCAGTTADILSLGEQQLPTSEERYPLDLVKCDTCHLVQLKHTVPSEKLYNDSYGYRSGINETIKADLQDIAEKALFLVKDIKTVVDIGANDGFLLSQFKPFVEGSRRRIAFEPVAKFERELSDHADEVHGFWPGSRPKADIITAVSCFYDFPEPSEAVQAMKESLAENGVIIIQQNYLLRMLENTAYDNICHEHLEYYSLLSLENLLNRHGLEVFRVEENSINGGSFRTYVCHKGERTIEQSVQTMRLNEQDATVDGQGLDTAEPYRWFANKAENSRDRLMEVIASASEDGTIYAYGASTRGSVLMQYGELAPFITAVVERNPDKIGKEYLGIPIISEEEAFKKPPDYKLILPYFHESIIEREKGDIPIILPLPTVRIV